MLSLAVITTKKNSLSFQGQHSTILNIKIANIIIRKNKDKKTPAWESF